MATMIDYCVFRNDTILNIQMPSKQAKAKWMVEIKNAKLALGLLTILLISFDKSVAKYSVV